MSGPEVADGRARVTRRNLLRTAMWGSLGLFAAEGAAATLRVLWPNKVVGFGGKVTAGDAQGFEVNSVTKVPEGRFYLVRLKHSFVAVYWKCPHLGCTVPWSPPEDPGRFHCPCHGSIFEMTGQKIAGPAPRSMDVMPVEITPEGKVVVDTGKIIQRINHDPRKHETPA